MQLSIFIPYRVQVLLFQRNIWIFLYGQEWIDNKIEKEKFIFKIIRLWRLLMW